MFVCVGVSGWVDGAALLREIEREREKKQPARPARPARPAKKEGGRERRMAIFRLYNNVYGHTTGKAPVPVPLTEVKSSQAF